jgi:hypothetical protein
MVICHEKCNAILVMASIALAMIKPEFLTGVIRARICYKKELRYHSSALAQLVWELTYALKAYPNYLVCPREKSLNSPLARSL